RGNVADLQEKKVREEEKRFSKGRSNTDTLIRFQEDMIQARLSKAQADYAYHVALVNLNKEEGSLLKEYWNEEF
ncbi:MAG: outer membrane protein TolC, partial [Lysobacterales bacterium]